MDNRRMSTPHATHAPVDTSTRTWIDLADARRLLVDTYPGIVLGLDLDGRILWLNPAASQRLGYDREELTGRPFVDGLVAREEIELQAAHLSKELGEPVAADAGVLTARLRRGAAADEQGWVLRHKEGALHPARLSWTLLRDHAGHATGLLAVEPWPRAEGDVQPQLVHHDSLTGLPTRAVLPDRAEMALQRAARNKSVVAMLLIELSGFDALCEEHGHTVGDDVLRATAGRLYFELRKTDTAVRLERGQFAAMLVDLHDARDAERVAQKTATALSAPVNVGVARIPLAARVGVSWYPAHGDQLLPLVEAAEKALATLPASDTGVASAPVPTS
jgi:diguanylate cyclase (GGDEF)-like protein/PAS domain S-box-containing protein